MSLGSWNDVPDRPGWYYGLAVREEDGTLTVPVGCKDTGVTLTVTGARTWGSYAEGSLAGAGVHELARQAIDATCEHKNTTRKAPLYVDGRPLYRCDDCGARLVYEDDVPSRKGLALLREPASGKGEA